MYHVYEISSPKRIGLLDFSILPWANATAVKGWWTGTVNNTRPHWKALTSLIMLVSWEIWKEHNARVFRNTAAPTMLIVERIKEEAHLWALAGAKYLSNVMPRE